MKTALYFSIALLAASLVSVFFSCLFLAAPEWRELGKATLPASCALVLFFGSCIVHTSNEIQNNRLRETFRATETIRG